MTDSSQTTLEEASRCPKCGQAGNQTSTKPLTSGSGKLLMFKCENSRCRWFNTEWPVQVSANGTIPLTLQRPKQFQPLIDDGGRTLANIERQLELETQKGSEINRRH